MISDDRLRRVIDAASRELPAPDAEFLRRVWSTPLDIYRRRLRGLGFCSFEHVLDAGCGHGQWTACLAELNHRVTAIDADPSRVDTARKMLALLNRPNVDFAVARLEDTGLAEGSVDAIFCYGVIQMTDVRTSVREMARILRPGGRLYLCTNGIGWYLHLLVRRPNASVVYDPRRVAKHAFRGTLRFLFRRQLNTAQSVILPSAWLGRLLDQAGFARTVIGPEGSLGRERAADWPSFFDEKYFGLQGVYELVANRGE